MRNRRIAIRWVIVGAIIVSWLGWAYVLLNSDIYLKGIIKPSGASYYNDLGSFGDAFGPIASLMASIAAAGALYAFISDRRDRNLQQFESNFFILLQNFESIRNQSYIGFGRKKNEDSKYTSEYKKLDRSAHWRAKKNFKDRAALRIVVYLIRERATISGYRNIKVVHEAYCGVFNRYVDMLGHYFRTLHHICRHIDEKCPGDKDYYARILRASLSSEELCLVAYNCIVGEGRLKFADLAVRFSLFHNLHRADLDEYQSAELGFFMRKLPYNAFRFEDNPPITYDD